MSTGFTGSGFTGVLILTKCAACAAPLAHDAPRCVRCKTRYCNRTCQMDHWRRGHKQICKKIHRGGNAEHYHADNKYAAAVKVAVKACAAATKGQTCYICTEAVHWKTKEGLVSGFCACRGTMGIAHVSCLVRQAESAMDDAMSTEDLDTRGSRWHTCRLCGQKIHSEVRRALGYQSLPDLHEDRGGRGAPGALAGVHPHVVAHRAHHDDAAPLLREVHADGRPARDAGSVPGSKFTYSCLGGGSPGVISRGRGGARLARTPRAFPRFHWTAQYPHAWIDAHAATSSRRSRQCCYEPLRPSQSGTSGHSNCAHLHANLVRAVSASAPSAPAASAASELKWWSSQQWSSPD